MKKIFVAVICFVIFFNFSVCQAKTVRISDDGPEILYQEIKETIPEFNKGTNRSIYVGKFLKTFSTYNLYGENYRISGCQIYEEGKDEQIGQILFHVDKEGYVFGLRIIFFSRKGMEVGYIPILGSTLVSLRIESESGLKLTNGFDFQDEQKTGYLAINSTWSSNINKKINLYLRSFKDTEDGLDFVLLAER